MTCCVKPRTIKELRKYAGEDICEGHPLRMEPERERAFLFNPFDCGNETICQWVGYADNKVAGWNYSFPLAYLVDGQEIIGTTGSSLNVQEFARKSDLGLLLPAYGVEQTSRDGLAVAASVSQMGTMVHKVCGYRFFMMPRYVALWNVRPVVEMKLKGVVAEIVNLIGNACIVVYRFLMSRLVAFKLRGLRFERVGIDDKLALEAVETLLKDNHRFQELHDVRWLKWALSNSFCKEGPLVAVLAREAASGKPIACYLTKMRYHAQASSRGFKNVMLGSIMEWGCVDGFTRLGWVVVRAALSLAGSCDAVEFVSADDHLQRFVRRCGWRKVGESNFSYKVLKNASYSCGEAMRDVANWRLRPAMGDNTFS